MKMMSNETKVARLPKLTKRAASERGRLRLDWLDARYTFSFGDYFDPDHMGFSSLRVMNNDVIEPGGGFRMHPHRDAEIFTYIIEGKLQHTDCMGNGSVIEAGNLQYMSAGSGVRHSEFNPSKEHRTHLYQIWLKPNASGGSPRYAEVPLGERAKANALTHLFSGEPQPGVVRIRQNAEVFFGRLAAGSALTTDAHEDLPNAWVQVIKGQVHLLGQSLTEADGLAIEGVGERVEITAEQDAQLLLFRLS